jgi:hypothetical protein
MLQRTSKVEKAFYSRFVKKKVEIFQDFVYFCRLVIFFPKKGGQFVYWPFHPIRPFKWTSYLKIHQNNSFSSN